MNFHAAALLVIRVLGLIIVVLRLPDLLAGIGEVFREGFIDWLSNMTFRASQSGYFLGAIGLLIQFALGLYLLLGGKRLVRLLLRGLPGLPGICARCGYDIRGLEGGRCPECGAKIPDRPEPVNSRP